MKKRSTEGLGLLLVSILFFIAVWVGIVVLAYSLPY